MDNIVDTTLIPLYELIRMDIPKGKKAVAGFLEIVHQSTKENPISNVYRYFLDPKESPEISKLLLETLLELLAIKTPDKGVTLQLDSYTVHREFPSANGRIDLVIDSKEGNSAIIIESKIYHTLQNDLHSYWKALDYPDNNKRGILLSLSPVGPLSIGNPNFINITHAEWLNRARSKGIPHSIEPRTFIYFNDFVNTMNNLTNSRDVSAQVRFYLDHFQKIDDALATREAAINYIINQLSNVCGHLDWSVYGTLVDWRNLWNEQHGREVYLTVFPMEILKNPEKFRVVLELSGPARKFETEIRNLIAPDLFEIGMQPMVNEEKHVVHLAVNYYQVPGRDIEQFSATLIKVIREELEPIRLKIASFLLEKGIE